MGRALRSLLLFATLSFWLSSAGAFCVSEALYDYVMRSDEPAPEQTLPCCVAAGRLAASAPRDASPAHGGVAASGDTARAFNEPAPLRDGPLVSPLRWRAYCERSLRLLR
jgi:hypothetical protein